MKIHKTDFKNKSYVHQQQDGLGAEVNQGREGDLKMEGWQTVPADLHVSLVFIM